jgi:hypothetical protein
MGKKEKDAKQVEKARQARKKYEGKMTGHRVRYNAEEHKILSGHAERSGKEIIAYIRDVSLNPKFKIVPARPKVNIETKAQINKIGINFNQITRSMNNYYEVKNFDKIQSELQEISRSLRGILDKI